jgi:hypothetical protein
MNKIKADLFLEVITTNAHARSGTLYGVKNPVTE